MQNEFIFLFFEIQKVNVRERFVQDFILIQINLISRINFSALFFSYFTQLTINFMHLSCQMIPNILGNVQITGLCMPINQSCVFPMPKLQRVLGCVHSYIFILLKHIGQTAACPQPEPTQQAKCVFSFLRLFYHQTSRYLTF